MKKKTRFQKFLLVSIVSLLLLTACTQMPQIPGMTSSQQSTPETTSIPLVVEETGITIEGHLVPKQSVEIGFTTTGQVEEVLFHEGDEVIRGDVLARLTGKEQLEAALASAEYELFLAKQARQLLDDDLKTAQIQALQNLNTARQTFHDAERKFRSLGGTPNQNDVDIAKTQVVFAKNALDKAKDAYAPYEKLPEDNLTRARLQVELANKQKDYDNAVRNYNRLTGKVNDFDVTQAQTDYEISKGQLEIAQENYDLIQLGPDKDTIASAEARIIASEARVKAAKAELDKLELVATIDGKIVHSDLLEGKSIVLGQPVVEIADFSEWDVETENLTEIDVVDISVGQKVSITPDALPEVKLTGKVISISNTFQEVRGDITYLVTIKLDNVDPRIRWGMTVVIDFEEKP